MTRVADQLVLAALPRQPRGYRRRASELEVALCQVWLSPSADNVASYLHALRPVVRNERPAHQWERWNTMTRGPIDDVTIGPYQVEASLGMGGCGEALAVRHMDTDESLTLKLNCGAEGLVFEWLGGTLPPQFLRVYSWAWENGDVDTVSVVPAQPDPDAEEPCWVVRERADETWADYRRRLNGERPPLAKALGTFAVACAGVAALHAQRVYHWSAHERNLFRVGDEWKLGDLGRCVIATSPDDPRLAQLYGLEDHSPAERSARLEAIDRGPWRSLRSWGVFPTDPTRELRLRVDDCAMLGGLLCDLLGGNRWEIFFEAISTTPLCGHSYVLTGVRSTDAMVSAVLNRCWRGDAGGVLGLANGLGLAAGYQDAQELLADVVDAFDPRTSSLVA